MSTMMNHKNLRYNTFKNSIRQLSVTNMNIAVTHSFELTTPPHRKDNTSFKGSTHISSHLVIGSTAVTYRVGVHLWLSGGLTIK